MLTFTIELSIEGLKKNKTKTKAKFQFLCFGKRLRTKDKAQYIFDGRTLSYHPHPVILVNIVSCYAYL